MKRTREFYATPPTLAMDEYLHMVTQLVAATPRAVIERQKEFEEQITVRFTLGRTPPKPDPAQTPKSED